jgi:hypothetical protein
MAKSAYAVAVDAIQAELRPRLTGAGFRARGRTFNRLTEDGLTQVVNLQMGAADPPGTTSVPGLREDLHGLFTVNLGVYVPEVATYHGGGAAPAWVQDYHCCVRARLGEACGAATDLWWKAQTGGAVVDDVWRRLETGGLPFLERFARRDRILREWDGRTESQGAGRPPRIVLAIILAGRGDGPRARQLLSAQARETRSPGHPTWVRALAERLGLGALDA